MTCQGSNVLIPPNGVDVHELSFTPYTLNNVKVVLHSSFSSAMQSNSTENVIYRVAISKRLCNKKRFLIFGLALNRRVDNDWANLALQGGVASLRGFHGIMFINPCFVVCLCPPSVNSLGFRGGRRRLQPGCRGRASILSRTRTKGLM